MVLVIRALGMSEPPLVRPVGSTRHSDGNASPGHTEDQVPGWRAEGPAGGPSARPPDPYDVSALEGKGPLTLDRWSIDPGSGAVRQQSLDDRAQEFPRVDDRIVSQPHRYGYSAAIGVVSRDTVSLSGDLADRAFANALLKHDLTAGTAEAHEFGRDATAGEAVFAPASATAGEDDGYVLAIIHNPERGAADLVLLAAQDFTAEPVARVHLPARIPLGFHGSALPDQ